MNNTITYGGVTIQNPSTYSIPIPLKNNSIEYDTLHGGLSGSPLLRDRKAVVTARYIIPPSNPNPLIDLGDNQVDDGFAKLAADLYMVKELYEYDNTAKLVLQTGWYYRASIDEIVPQETTFSFVDYNIQFTLRGGRRYSTTLDSIDSITSGANAIVATNFTELTEIDTPILLYLTVALGQTYNIFTNVGSEVLTLTPTVSGQIIVNLEEYTITRITNDDAKQEHSGLFPRVKYKSALTITVTNMSAANFKVKYRKAKL